MTISLDYLEDLSRVRITVEDWPDGAVQIQRSTDPDAPDVVWERGIVRGAQTLVVSDGTAMIDDYEFVPDVANYYRILPVDPDGEGIEVDSITPSLGGKVWLKHIQYPNLNRPVIIQSWSPSARESRDRAAPVSGRSVPIVTSDLRGSPEFTLELATGDLYDPEHDGAAEAALIDLTLAVGGIYLIHVPKGLPIPGGYVAIAESTIGRMVDVGDSPYRITLPCQVVAPPSPRVVGTTLTWDTVWRLYGSWEAMWAGHLSWESLWDVLGDPNDLEVL